MKKKEMEIRIGVGVAPVDMNAMRVGLSKEKIQLEFASVTEEDEQSVATVFSQIRIPPERLKNVIDRLISVGVLYEKKYHKRIGFESVSKIEAGIKDGND